MHSEYVVSDHVYRVSVLKLEESYVVKINDEEINFVLNQIDAHRMILESDQQRYKAFIAADSVGSYVHLDQQDFHVEKLTQRHISMHKREHVLVDDSPEITTPMPGKIIKIFINIGDVVKPKQSLMILEAMKMENNIVAQRDGVVKCINFKEGDLVEAGQTLLELE